MRLAGRDRHQTFCRTGSGCSLETLLSAFLSCRLRSGRFRKFTQSPGFHDLFDLSPQEREALDEDDEALLNFRMRFLKQVRFGKQTIAKKPDADRRGFQERRNAIISKQRQNGAQHRLRDPRDDPEAK